MSGGMWGADSEALDQLATVIADAGNEVDEIFDAVVADAKAVHWHGWDAIQFHSQLTTVLKPMVAIGLEIMREGSQRLRDQARQQREASAVPLGHGVQYQGETTITPPDSAAGYMDRLERLGPGEFEIIRLGGDPPRYVVLLKGIDQVGLTDNATDSLNVILERLGLASQWREEVLRALDDATAADRAAGRIPQLGMITHSGGGIVAANLASDPAFHGGKYQLTDLVITGSGVKERMGSIPPDISVLQMEHSRDIVPKISQPVGLLQQTMSLSPIGPIKSLVDLANPNHQFDVFGPQPGHDGPGYQFSGGSGHDVQYYEDRLRSLEGRNSLVDQFGERYGHDGTATSYRYQLKDH